jgi:hypothetical protein
MTDSFDQIIAEVLAMHNKKRQDYGRTNDPYSNVRASEVWGIPGWVGALVRQQDKTRRLQKFAAEGNLANESVEDSLLDSIVYGIIALALWRETNAPQERQVQQDGLGQHSHRDEGGEAPASGGSDCACCGWQDTKD